MLDSVVRLEASILGGYRAQLIGIPTESWNTGSLGSSLHRDSTSQ
jgi:hypothetical protein